MSDWIDKFGSGAFYLDDGEKLLMRFAMDKQRQLIIKELKREVEAEKCNCGTLCEGWENGMLYAIDMIEQLGKDE